MKVGSIMIIGQREFVVMKETDNITNIVYDLLDCMTAETAVYKGTHHTDKGYQFMDCVKRYTRAYLDYWKIQYAEAEPEDRGRFPDYHYQFVMTKEDHPEIRELILADGRRYNHLYDEDVFDNRAELGVPQAQWAEVAA